MRRIARSNRSRMASLLLVLLLLLLSIPLGTVSSSAETIAAVNTRSNGNPYYIMVNRQMNTVTVYALDDRGYYSVPYKAMICSCGRSGHATPTGTYRTPNSRYTWRLMVDGSYGQYASRITGSILFHSVCFTRASANALMTEEYNMLGNHASLGCVRLQVADAKWIYDNCPTGTIVTIYDSSNPGALGKPKKPIDNISSSPYKNWDPTDPSSSNPWRFSVQASADGAGTVSGSGNYRYGASVTLQATPLSGARFEGWFDASGNRLTTDLKLTRTVAGDAVYTARFTQMAEISAVASRSGTVSGGGSYVAGTAVTLQANPSQGKGFEGWFDADGNKLSSAATYRFTASGDRTVYAMFSGDVFGDIAADAWYLEDVMEAYDTGVTKGVSDILFAADQSFTRAMAVQMLKRIDAQIPVYELPVVRPVIMAGPEDPEESSVTVSNQQALDDVNAPAAENPALEESAAEPVEAQPEETQPTDLEASEPAIAQPEEPEAPQPVSFADVAEDAWYAEAVQWAAGRGIVNGIGGDLFAPDLPITRADMITILGRYLDNKRVLPKEISEALPYADAAAIPSYAETWFAKGISVGLIRGYEDNTVRPANILTRAEGATLMMRTKRLVA